MKRGLVAVAVMVLLALAWNAFYLSVVLGAISEVSS